MRHSGAARETSGTSAEPARARASTKRRVEAGARRSSGIAARARPRSTALRAAATKSEVISAALLPGAVDHLGDTVELVLREPRLRAVDERGHGLLDRAAEEGADDLGERAPSSLARSRGGRKDITLPLLHVLDVPPL